MSNPRPIITAAGMSAESILKALAPEKAIALWRELEDPLPRPDTVIDVRRFTHPRGYLVMSAVELIEGEGRGTAPEYHVSVSKWNPKKQKMDRCPQDEALWVLSCFGLDGWEEDNHVPGGFVRNYWRPVAEPDVGKECPCKESEPAIVEGDYEWRQAP